MGELLQLLGAAIDMPPLGGLLQLFGISIDMLEIIGHFYHNQPYQAPRIFGTHQSHCQIKIKWRKFGLGQAKLNLSPRAIFSSWADLP